MIEEVENPVTHEYSMNAQLYARHRPTYPQELFGYIGSLVSNRSLVWDCATGNGQAAAELATLFDRVIATDASKEQLKHAREKENIEYLVAEEHVPTIADESVDLVSVATAIHWLDREKFYAEAQRVLKPGGLVAIWGYTGKDNHIDLNDRMAEIVEEHLNPYYGSGIKVAHNAYENVGFPFERIETPPFSIRKNMMFEDFTEYMLTWSASQKYQAIHGESLLPLFRNLLKDAWGNLQEPKEIKWDLILHFGRKK